MGSKQLALIALLIFSGHPPCSRTFLADTLWSKTNPEGRKNSLRQALRQIRSATSDEIYSSVIRHNGLRVVIHHHAVELVGDPDDGDFLQGIDLLEEPFSEWLVNIRSDMFEHLSRLKHRWVDGEAFFDRLSHRVAKNQVEVEKSALVRREIEVEKLKVRDSAENKIEERREIAQALSKIALPNTIIVPNQKQPSLVDIAKALELALLRDLSPASSAGHQVAMELEGQMARLVDGHVLFNPPSNMRVGRSQIIEARVTKALTKAFEEGLKGEGELVLDQLKVGSVIRAMLTGNGFTISSDSEPEQPILGDDFSHWEWNVRPEKAGKRKLTLRVSVVFKIHNISDTVKDLPTFEREIHVEVNPVYFASNFLGRHWKWIAGTVAIPVALWVGAQAGVLGDLGELVKSLTAAKP